MKHFDPPPACYPFDPTCPTTVQTAPAIAPAPAPAQQVPVQVPQAPAAAPVHPAPEPSVVGPVTTPTAPGHHATWNPPTGWHTAHLHMHIPTVSAALEVAATAGITAGVTVAAAVALDAATPAGTEPRTLRNYAAGSLVLPAASIAIKGSWTAPLSLVWQGAQALEHGWWLGGLAGMAPFVIPVGWTLATLVCTRRRDLTEQGLGKTPRKALRAKRRHELARARNARSAAKQVIPLVAGWPVPNRAVIGVCSHRTDPTPSTFGTMLAARHDPLFGIPLSALDEHMFVIGNSGSGKTTMKRRLALAAFYADWQRYLAGGPRPLLLFIDCGGDEKTAASFVEIFGRLGVQPDRIGVWPTTTALDLFSLEAKAITETLQSMVCPAPPTDSAQEYFFQARRRVVQLAMGTTDHVGRPVPPPRGRHELIRRLANGERLKALYPHDQSICEEIDGFEKTKPPMVASVAGLLRAVFDSLGSSFDGGKPLSAFDVIYMVVPGTTLKSTARAQASALVTMALQYAAEPDHGRRIRMDIDETSAVNDSSADIGIIGIIERARKLKMSLMISAQNVEGLAADPTQARRIMVGSSGGAILMRCEGQDEVAKVFGTNSKPENTRHTLGSKHGDEGSTGLSDDFLVNPDALREMSTGDAVWVHSRHAVWGHVSDIDLATLPRIEQTPDTILAPVEPRARLVVAPSPSNDPVDDAVDDVLPPAINLDDDPDIGETA